MKFIICVIDDCWFKYNSILDTKNDTSRADCFDNNLGFEPRISRDTQIKRHGNQSFFTEHYRKHSRQLVDALQKWEKQLKFTSYEYEEGMVIPDRIEPEYIPYMKEMKQHLDNAYPDLLPKPLEIETNCKDLCNQIQNIMEYKTDIVPSRRSFEKIIIDRIKTVCPSLKRSNDIQFTENNIYIDSYVFRKIFDFVSSGESKINLYIEPGSTKNVEILWYEHAQGLGQGEEEAMGKLKEAIENLLTDEEIISRIKEYNHLMDKLNNDEQISKMHIVIREFHTQIHGDHVVGGYPACRLCDPDIPVDMTQQLTAL
jgi:superoxide dismutase